MNEGALASWILNAETPRTQNDQERDPNKTVDLLQATIGDFGKWQCRISILMSLLKFPIAWFQLGIVFLAPLTEFWCKRPTKYEYMSVEEWKNFIKPDKENLKHYSALETGSCVMWNVESHPKNKSTVVPCLWGYDYNRTIIKSSIITEWDLVCSRERLVDVTQITLMFGVLLGTILFGVAADKFGRRKILMVAIVLQCICGILSAISPWLWLFILSRFFLAMANGGTMTTSFVMCMEVVGGVWRTIVPILYQIPFGLGNTSMAGIAYFLRDWRDLQFTLSMLSALYIVYFSFVPESPRWLMAVGRTEEAIKILEHAAEENGVDKQSIARTIEEMGSIHGAEKNNKEKAGLFALFRTSELRRRTIVLSFSWLFCGISFFGFSLYLGQISDNLYFAVAVGGLIAVPGTFLCVMIVKRCGRRISIAVANCFTAVCFIAILAVPRGVYAQDWPRIIIAGGGVIGLSVSLPALYLFTGELYPTVLRNAGVGTSVMCSKLGSMLAPLVITLGQLVWFVPLLVLGVLTIIEAALVLFLPETLDTVLPETIGDIEVMISKPDNEVHLDNLQEDNEIN